MLGRGRQAVGEELSFRWEFAKRGQWRPGAYSAEPYLDTQLKEQDLCAPWFSCTHHPAVIHSYPSKHRSSCFEFPG